MTPKILHLYWGKNRPLSYLRYLTVKTFISLNPVWQVKLWVPTSINKEYIPWKTGEQIEGYNGKDYLVDLEVCLINMSIIGIPDDLPEVHKADLFRWYILGKEGGVWSDMDILYVRSITERLIQSWTGSTICKYAIDEDRKREFTAIGFMISSDEKGMSFFSRLFRFGLSKIPQKKYQAFGALLFDEFIAIGGDVEGIVSYFDPNLVYPYHDDENIVKYFKPSYLSYSEETIGLHWYAGNPISGKAEAMIVLDDLERLADKFAIARIAFMNTIKYSILMPYYKRPDQLYTSLVSFAQHYSGRNDFEIIIAIDRKSNNADIARLNIVMDDFQGLSLRSFMVSLPTRNPALAYNEAARKANGTILVITSPECFHATDILKGFDDELRGSSNICIMCGCQHAKKMSDSSDYNKIVFDNTVWYQHSKHRNARCHFCSAITKDNFFKIGGFDETYCNGICFEDDDFRNSIDKAGIVSVLRDDLLVVHQMHPKDHPKDYDYTGLHHKNRDYYDKKWGKDADRAEWLHVEEL
jgi:Glycosyltransferase sugar-binding region containing DXD motif